MQGIEVQQDQERERKEEKEDEKRQDTRTAQEYSTKGRSFCLTLHQLRCLSQLINRFLLMEEKVEELSSEMLLLPCFSESKNVQVFQYKLLNMSVEYIDISEDSAEYVFHSINLSFDSVYAGVLKKAGGELLIGENRANETSALSEQLLQVKKSTVLEFGWRNAFKDLSSSVAHCITIAVEDFSSKILQQEQNEQTSAACYVMHLVNVQHVKESWGIIREDERPKQISKACIKDL
ncbi:hypothetical protein JD844_008804 [Phrynosoma platyrhinos]|uniref:Uncharacterized protein n=1 Tax=Phrynosoma platyrhinos TaxID=52577 RepID=A0ABQ7TFA9_PHRPL|nr:hypothetical protein JD844_008804 [Phrynosoma platyrhinos]